MVGEFEAIRAYFHIGLYCSLWCFPNEFQSREIEDSEDLSKADYDIRFSHSYQLLPAHHM